MSDHDDPFEELFSLPEGPLVPFSETEQGRREAWIDEKRGSARV